jgi:hypothetical protein
LFRSIKKKEKNARFYRTQRIKTPNLNFSKGIQVTKVEPDGLGTQRRCRQDRTQLANKTALQTTEVVNR